MTHEDSYKSTEHRVVATYDYTDADGNLVCRKQRYEPKGFSFLSPTENGGWEYGLKGINPPLYNLPQVINNEEIFIVEGEKDADNLMKVGFVATTSPLGAGKWSENYREFFRGKLVYVIPDNDDVGKEHAELIKKQISSITKGFKILDLTTEYPDLKIKGDISDIISDIGADRTTTLLKRLIDNTTFTVSPTSTSAEWEMVKLFDEVPLPPFPIECLPEIFQAYVKTISDYLATPIEMAVLVALAIIAVCLQGKVFIQANEDYFESTNLYVLIIADPGERKSPLLNLMVKPLYNYEETVNPERRKKIHEEEGTIKSKEKELSEIVNSGNFERYAELQTEIDELKERQTQLLRLTSDDFTVEALTSLMANNGGKMAVISSEGGMFDNITGRYSTKNSFETLLKAYTGDTIRVDRKSRDTELIKKAFLTILLMAQDSKLQGIMSNGSLRGQGLLGRFLYCQPDSPLGMRKFKTPALNHDVVNRFNDVVFQLLELDEEHEHILALSDGADKVCQEFFEWLEPQLIAELNDIRDWASKLHGTTMRIAGILHCIDNNGLGDSTISKQMMDNACRIAKYFIEHAKKAFSLMGANDDIIKAKIILQKLKQVEGLEVSQRDIFQKCKGNQKFAKVDTLKETLNFLEEYGYIRTKKQSDMKSRGRPHSVMYELNPMYFDKM